MNHSPNSILTLIYNPYSLLQFFPFFYIRGDHIYIEKDGVTMYPMEKSALQIYLNDLKTLNFTYFNNSSTARRSVIFFIISVVLSIFD